MANVWADLWAASEAHADVVTAYVFFTVVIALIYRALFWLSHWLTLVASRAGLVPGKVAYADQPRGLQIEWQSRVLSNVNAALTALLGAVELLSVSDWITDTVSHSAFKMALLSGYLLHDFELVLRDSGLFSVAILIHHLLGLVSGYYAVSWRAYHKITMIFFLTETTTPFINARWFLAAWGWRDGLAYNWNGFAIWASWTVFRIVPLPLLYSILAPLAVKLVDAEEWFQLLIVCGIPSTIGVLNLFWYWLIFRGFIKVMRERWSGKRSASKFDAVADGVPAAGSTAGAATAPAAASKGSKKNQ
eukprot:c40202_g1_i1.p1 GENE.c40202_g1_i1~~c40202_g1_i1.p1  ORF type:complete len:304 (-),score=42.93 c40202_g1_i1:19-930(-)